MYIYLNKKLWIQHDTLFKGINNLSKPEAPFGCGIFCKFCGTASAQKATYAANFTELCDNYASNFSKLCGNYAANFSKLCGKLLFSLLS